MYIDGFDKCLVGFVKKNIVLPLLHTYIHYLLIPRIILTKKGLSAKLWGGGGKEKEKYDF